MSRIPPAAQRNDPICTPDVPGAAHSTTAHPDDSLAHSAKEKADLLGYLFASNLTLVGQGRSLFAVIIRYQKSHSGNVLSALSSLDIHKSSGPDGIPLIELRTCAPELAPILMRLFRYLYSLDTIPKCWKTASIYPIT
ncbi:unnamed protein product [Pieris brassicae]|uniref:Reverse transcriptase domain-containing protein n=1 Tax=Pieris brassicae TaxID=7116 RepID=A0A9P0XGA3_PIEBR|nr:unnamed protein product [Pieris brassicae]